jgi:Transposase DDE domain
MRLRPLHGERGRPRQRPDCVLGNRGYDETAIRRGLRSRHILPWLAMRRTAHGSGLGRWRWVVERTFAWFNQFRRLRVRSRCLVPEAAYYFIIESSLCIGAIDGSRQRLLDRSPKVAMCRVIQRRHARIALSSGATHAALRAPFRVFSLALRKVRAGSASRKARSVVRDHGSANTMIVEPAATPMYCLPSSS